MKNLEIKIIESIDGRPYRDWNFFENWMRCSMFLFGSHIIVKDF
jgi:hypothetical protein